MRLYEINEEIERILTEGIDPETGELTVDAEALNALQMERDAKLENIALYWKDLTSDAAALKAEIETLTERKRAAERKAERIKDYLGYALEGGKFQTARVACSFRTASAVEIGPEFMPWAQQHDEYLRYKEPEINKKAVADAIRRGEVIPGAEIVTRQSLMIK